MAGILEYFSNPANMGLLNLSAGLLQAGGPSPTPVSFGQALGRGLQQGAAGFATAQQSQLAQEKLKQEAELLKLHGKLYEAQTGKTNAELVRMQKLAEIMGGNPSASVGSTAPTGLSDNAAAGIGAPWAAASGLPQPAPDPFEGYKNKAQLLVQNGFLDEGNKVAEFVTKMQPNLEFKDGVWYNKATGAPVRGGAGINQQGFGYQTNVGPNGQIGVAPLPGALDTFRQQQEAQERAKAGYDLVTVPPTGPNAPPTFASRLSLIPGANSAPGGSQAPAAPIAAGMSPAATAEQAAAATQQNTIAQNYGKIYNDLQNASMANPSKIAKTQRIGALLGDFEGGKLSGTGLEFARAANSLGLKVDSRLPNKEAAEALTNAVSLELRSTAEGGGMPGAMSDADRAFLKAMTPQMAQTAEGRRLIIESRVKVMERENQVAKMARQYKEKYKKLDEDFFNQLSGWSERNPLFKK